jgi:hypothetical protein
MNSIRLWAILTALAGLASVAVIIAFERLPEVMVAGDCWPRHAALLFEFAKSPEDFQAIFGSQDSECRPKNIAAMDAVNTLDVRLFIPAYTAFVVFAALFLAGGKLHVWTLAAVAAAVLACAADYLETIKLLAYTPDLNPTPNELATSIAAAWTKFSGLAVNALCLAVSCFTGRPRRRVLGTLLCLPLAGVTLMAIDPNWTSALMLFFMAGWGPLFVVAARSSITGKP